MLALQVILFAILRFARRRRPLVRTVVAAAPLLAAVPAVNLLLLVAIPLQHLVEHSTEPEVNGLAEVCRADGVVLMPAIASLHRHDGAALAQPRICAAAVRSVVPYDAQR